ncbi:type II secretion system protein E (GspE), partial [Candidatus Magnetobacterium bavaricum]
MQEQLTGNVVSASGTLNASNMLNAGDFPKVPLVLDGISARFLNRNLIIPCDVRDNRLRVIMANPGDMDIIDALSVATGHEIDAYSADENLIKDYLDKFFGKEATVNKIIENIGDNSFEFKEEYDEDVDHLKGLASEAPIIKLVNLLITRAIEGRASD